MSEIFVKTATLDEYAEVVGFAQGENWNFCREDLAIWMKCDRPEAFMVAIKNGQVVGGIMSLLKSNGFGYVSFFVVKKEERGSGVGLTLFRKAMETQMDVNSVLISAPLMTNKYRDIFGYQIIPNLQVIDVKGSPQIPEEYKSLRPDLKFISGTDIDPQLLIEYDRSIVPYERSTWLQLWLRHPNGKSLVAVDQQGRPVGYAVIRTGPLRVALGPVYADEVKITKALLARLTEAKQTEVDKLGLYFRYSSDNKDMKHIAEEMNLVQCGHNNVQYRNVPAEYDSKKIFAFSDFGVNYA